MAKQIHRTKQEEDIASERVRAIRNEIVDSGMKVCGTRIKIGGRAQTYPVCGKRKPLSEFRLITTKRNGREIKQYDVLCWDCRKGYHRKRWDREDAKAKQRILRARYRHEFEILHPKPNGCEACGRHRKLVVDHDHETGKFRGWLCGHCNSAEGLLASPNAANGLWRYMKRTMQMDLLAPKVKKNGTILDFHAG